MSTTDPVYWVEKLGLKPHPEGGYYRQTYISDLVLPQRALPESFHGDRAASTAIYFLLTSESFSAFHRIPSDEVWHFYQGSALLVHVIASGGRYSQIRLGSNPEANEVFQAVVKTGSWFASELAPQENGGHDHYEKPFALVGCTVSPGFHFDDFELAKCEELAAIYPQHRDLIQRMTRQ